MDVEENMTGEGPRFSRRNDHDDGDFTGSMLSLESDSRADDDRAEDSLWSKEGLEAELQEASEAMEASEGRLQVKLMVGAAVLKGLERALAKDDVAADPDPAESEEADLHAGKEQLREGAAVLNRAIITLQGTVEELMKLVDDDTSKNHRERLEMLTKREGLLGRVKEIEKMMEEKEGKLLRIAEGITDRNLKEEALEMNVHLQEYIEARQSMQMEMDVQSRKYGYEKGLKIESFREHVEELVEEINTLQSVLSGMQIRGVASEFSKQRGQMDETKLFHQVKSGDAEEMTSYLENEKKQLEAPGENIQMQREAERRITSLEEGLVKSRLHQKCQIELEEQSWMFESEMILLSAYVEASYQEYVQQAAREHVDANTTQVSKQTDLTEERDKLMEKKAENVVGLKADILASSNIVDNLQTEVESQAGMLAQSRRDYKNGFESDLGRREAKVNERQKESVYSGQQLEEAKSDNRKEDVEAPEGFDENEWNSHVQDDNISALVEKNKQEDAQEIAHLQEQLDQKHVEISSLRNEVAEKTHRLDSYKSDLSDLQRVLVDDEQEPCDCRHTAEITHGDPVLMEQQPVVQGALRVVQNLRNFKAALVADIEIEREKVRRLEEALAEEKWKYQVELDVATTLFREEWDRGAATQSTANQLLSSYEQIYEELGVNKGSNKEKVPTLSVPLLVRQNSELRREKEQLLEQKTDEIYKLKGDFYKQLEALKRGQSSSLLRRTESAQDGKGRALWMKAKLPDIELDSEFDVEPRREERRFLDALSQTDEQIRERERQLKDVSADLEVKEKQIRERERQLKDVSADLEVKEKQILTLEGAISRSNDEASVLRTEAQTLQQYLRSHFEGRMHELVALFQQAENDFCQRMKKYNLRLDEAKSRLKLVPKQSGSIASSKEGGYQQYIKDLQKAEAEVDLLGDEVDSLMQVLETVYNVLNHYAPVIQHYPGMAELLKIVRQQVLQGICVSNGV